MENHDGPLLEALCAVLGPCIRLQDSLGRPWRCLRRRTWWTSGATTRTSRWRAKGEPALWLHLHKGNAQGGAHIAFRAPSHAAIKAFHGAGLKAGGKDNGAAGHRKDYSPTYYAAFLLDPDGNNVEAVST